MWENTDWWNNDIKATVKEKNVKWLPWLYKKGSSKDCNSYIEISHLIIVGGVYSAILEKETRSVVQSHLDDL